MNRSAGVVESFRKTGGRDGRLGIEARGARKRSWRRAGTAVVAMVLSGSAGSAGEYFVNSSDVTVWEVPHDAQVGARIRFSPTAFDVALDAGGGPGLFSDPNPDFLATHLGNMAAMAGVTYDFSLEHRLGQGYVFTVTREGTGVAKVIGWGSNFSPELPANATRSALLRGESPDFSDHGGPTTFNALSIEARATLAGSSLSFSDLSFSSPTLLWGSGVFQGGTVTPGTVDPWNDPTSSLPEEGYWRQLLVADANLAGHNWTLSGSLSGTRSGVGNDEEVRLLIEGVSVSAEFAGLGDLSAASTLPVPEPGTWWSGACLALGLTAWGVRRSMAGRSRQ